MKTPTPLPEPLRYLQPFVKSLSKLPPDALNEDIDASRLDAALRKRLRGLDEDAAVEVLAKDRELLESWLKNDASPNHPAHWVLGYLLLPEMAAHLIRPPTPPPQGPTITFETPNGWKVKAVPFALNLKRGKTTCSIMAIDEFTFDLLLHQWEQTRPIQPSGVQVSTLATEVSFGECHGWKYLRQQTSPVRWSQIDYFLRVPGGHVAVRLGSMTGADFDESPLEAQLHTLRLSSLALLDAAIDSPQCDHQGS